MTARGQILSTRLRLGRLGPAHWAGLALFSVIAMVLFAMFQHWGNTTDVRLWGRSAFGWLFMRWNDTGLSLGGGDYSHGALIPVISLALVWFRRQALLDAPIRISWIGLGVVVAALLLHYTGAKVQQTRLSLFAFIGLSWGIPTYLFGLRVGLLLLFPCAYLLFAVPFNFLDHLAYVLQGVMTTGSRWTLAALGLKVQQVGHMLFASDGSYAFNVAVPCSGIRSLQALTALTAIYAFFTQPTLARKWILFLAAFPLAVVGNMARVVSIMLIAEGFDPRFAGEQYHDLSGFIVFSVAIVLMVFVGNLLGASPKELWNRWKLPVASPTSA